MIQKYGTKEEKRKFAISKKERNIQSKNDMEERLKVIVKQSIYYRLNKYMKNTFISVLIFIFAFYFLCAMVASWVAEIFSVVRAFIQFIQ